MDAFDVAWNALADAGLVDGLGGSQWRRCKDAHSGFATVERWSLAIHDWSLRDEAAAMAFMSRQDDEERKNGFKVRFPR